MKAGVESNSAGNPSGLDVSFCELEPVHIPGAVQPHGAVLAALTEGLLVTHASSNLAAILGLPVEAVLGRPLADVIGESACRTLAEMGPGDEHREAWMRSLSGPEGGELFLHAHITGRHLCIDIEPTQEQPRQRRLIFMARSVAKTFTHAASALELCKLAVCGLKAISGYDRVMAYRFQADGHGEVVAEALNPQLDPFLGQRYPATDIPPQARRLYLSQRVGAIADSSYVPVPICVHAALDDGTPLDLTHSALRSASPVHREYMRNMHTAASLTIGLAYGPELWGMLVCHHATPRIAGAELRAATEMVGQIVSLMLGSLNEVEIHARRIERAAILRALGDRLATPLPIVDAAGVVLRISGALFFFGQTPPVAEIERAITFLQPLADGDLFAIDNLGVRFPELVGCAAQGSGALLLCIESGSDDLILWFRPELLQTITWGGDPGETAVLRAEGGPISPRTSFVAWTESVSGCSAPWTEADLVLARELRVAIAAETARRNKAALRESQAELGLLVEHSGDAVIFLGFDSVRRYVSPVVERLLGWRPEEMVGRTALLGSTPTAFVHPDDLPVYLDARKAMQTDRVSELSICFRHLRRDGSWQWVDSRACLRLSVDGAGPEGIVVTLRDATERKTLEFKLIDALGRMERMALTDGLTGLANRRHLSAIAEAEWRRCARDHRPLSVLMLDADRFKTFNDRYGHIAGDECLCAIASQLKAATLRPGDLAARYGGEEFLLLLPQTDRVGALHVGERVRRLILNLGIAHVDNVVEGLVTVSIGIATAWPGKPGSRLRSIEDLLAAADAALYAAKANGRNQLVVAAE
jgi:diguanylate cyclase (GGDEF)-like protein/PAS domain S-box-containing protein